MYLSQAVFSNRIFQLKFGWVSNLTLVFYVLPSHLLWFDRADDTGWRIQIMASSLLCDFLQNPVTFALLIPTAVFSPALLSHTITTYTISSRRDQGLGLLLAQ